MRHLPDPLNCFSQTLLIDVFVEIEFQFDQGWICNDSHPSFGGKYRKILNQTCDKLFLQVEIPIANASRFIHDKHYVYFRRSYQMEKNVLGE